MNLKTFSRLESEVRGYIRSFPTVFARARGASLFDQRGTEYIDFLSGAGTLNYGHNNPILKRSLLAYIEDDGLVHGLDMATQAKQEFLEAFEKVILRPRSLSYKIQFPGPTGTNAVEAALKLARKVKGRQTIVAFTNGFHGVTLGSLANTGNRKFRDAAGVPLGHTVFMPYDGYLGQDVDTIAFFERMLSDSSSGLDLPAAVIVETVQGEGGVNVARFEWLRALERLCRQHDMLLIVDDIQMGCGRTGTFFSFEAAGISPDIVTLSKSISGYGLPMSLVLMKPHLDLWEPGAHNGTFRGHNLAFLTAKETLLHYWIDDALAREIRRKGELMRASLEDIAARHPDGMLTVRGRGMVQGLAARERGLANRIAAAAFGEGLVIETSGSQDQVLKLLPPLVVDDDQLRAGLRIIDASVAKALSRQAAARVGAAL